MKSARSKVVIGETGGGADLPISPGPAVEPSLVERTALDFAQRRAARAATRTAAEAREAECKAACERGGEVLLAGIGEQLRLAVAEWNANAGDDAGRIEVSGPGGDRITVVEMPPRGCWISVRLCDEGRRIDLWIRAPWSSSQRRYDMDVDRDGQLCVDGRTAREFAQTAFAEWIGGVHGFSGSRG
jgi:hypothetical protein